MKIKGFFSFSFVHSDLMKNFDKFDNKGQRVWIGSIYDVKAAILVIWVLLYF